MTIAPRRPLFPPVLDRLVFLGMRGRVLALERTTGAEVWRAELKGAGFVNLVLDGEDLLATTRGEIFCLDARTGQVKWNNPLKGMGFGLATVVTRKVPGGGGVGPLAEHLQREERQNAAAAGA